MPEPDDVMEAAAGWPVRSLYALAEGRYVQISNGWKLKNEFLIGGPLSEAMLPGRSGFSTWDRAKARAAPIGVLWRGLVINAAVWGVAGALAACGVRSVYVAARSSRRRRRGLCTGCGYDRAGVAADAVCPECGAVLENRAWASAPSLLP